MNVLVVRTGTANLASVLAGLTRAGRGPQHRPDYSQDRIQAAPLQRERDGERGSRAARGWRLCARCRGREAL